MKIKNTLNVKERLLQIDLKAKTANKHLLNYQNTAIKQNAFFIITISLDLFDKSVPFIVCDDEYSKYTTGQLRDLFFNRITKGNYSNLMFILSAFDPQRINRCIPEGWIENPPANVLYDLQIKDQLSAETLLPKYLKIKGNKAITLYSQTAEISVLPWLQIGRIAWVKQIVAPIETIGLNWAQKIRSECKATKTPYCAKFYYYKWKITCEVFIEQHPDALFHSAYDICHAPAKRKPEMKGIPFEDIFGKL